MSCAPGLPDPADPDTVDLDRIGAMRVLVVEDEPDLRRLLEQALREEGYAVDVAEDGPSGLYKATTWDYDALVLDLMLPGMTGWDVLARVRQAKSVPVLILTARDGLADRVRGLDTGADDYLVKPFALAELHARLRALIRRAAGQANPRITLGPEGPEGKIEIDTAAHTVTRAGETVHLTAREYSLVEMLALRRGQVVSRTDLYSHLFDEEDDSFSNLLDVHVSNIRKKLGKDFIQTRRGYGYVIE
jgi:two-component system OmpR family response regulator